MASKIEMLSPKKEIIDHFDSLINRVDIDIDECLEKYNQEQILSQLNCFNIRKRKVRGETSICLYRSDRIRKDKTVDEWPESTKVVDYLNRIRMRTIEELRKAQEETLEFYKQNSSQFKLNSMDEIRGELFKDKFHFQVLFKPEDTKYINSWIFNLYTFVTDFYISSTDINLLEKLIDSPELGHFDSPFVLDEKMVLIGLLQMHFFSNLETQKFPSHVIIVRKEELLNVKEIRCLDLKGVNLSASKTIELSNLETLELYEKNSEEFKIEGFSSLQSLWLNFQSANQVILTNLSELRRLNLNGKLSQFNLNSLSNLKKLKLCGRIMDDFNFQLFDNLCNQLKYIDISCSNFDNTCIEKLFYGRNFPYLSTLYIVKSNASVKLEKKLFDGLGMLRKLDIYHNKNLRIIDSDVFSNLIELEELHIAQSFIEFIDKTLFSNLINLKKLTLYDNIIESIDKNSFSNLHNLEYLDLRSNRLRSLSAESFFGLDNLNKLNLSHNKLVYFDLDIFDYIGKFVEIYLNGNPIVNKDEILNRCLQSNIKVYF